MSVDTHELRVRLEAGLGRAIQDLRRQPSPYSSTYPLEDLCVQLDDGTRLQLILKDITRPPTTSLKPAFITDPRREIDVYRSVLAERSLGTAYCHVAVADETNENYWLVLEKVQGVELYQIGDLTVWHAAARWLAQLHARSAVSSHLLRHTPSFYRLWPERAIANARHPDRIAALTWLAKRHEQVIERLLKLPATFIHGEFYASNVLVETSQNALRICPIDWEMAAIGPGLMDLAALTAGSWSADVRQSLADTYRDATAYSGDDADFCSALDCCRLQLALQWLGWSRDWQPPAAHAHDWLAEALAAAERLGL